MAERIHFDVLQGSGTIICGVIDTDKKEWVKGPYDVTDVACAMVAMHALEAQKGHVLVRANNQPRFGIMVEDLNKTNVKFDTQQERV